MMCKLQDFFRSCSQRTSIVPSLHLGNRSSRPHDASLRREDLCQQNDVLLTIYCVVEATVY